MEQVIMAMTNPEDNVGRISAVERLRRWTGRGAFIVPVLLIVLIFVSAYLGITREINRIAEDRLSREITLATTTVNDKIFSAIRNLESYENEIRTALEEPGEVQVNRVLGDVTNSEINIDHVAIFSRAGRDLYHYPPEAEPPGIDYSMTHWYRDYVESGRRATASDVIGPGSESPLAVITVPLENIPGHVGISLYGAIQTESITAWLSPFQIGAKGGLVLLDRHDRVVASSASLELETGQKYDSRCRDCLKEKRMTFDDWRLVAILPRAEIRSSILSSLFIPLIVGLGLIGLSGLIGLRIRALNTLSAKQQEAIDAAGLQMEDNFRELESGLLPQIPETAGWEISLNHTSATHGTRIGGDFFDVFTLDSGDLVTVIGDVSGKGLAASAIATGARTAMRAFFETTDDPREVLGALNRYMLGQTPRNIFITLLICVIGQSKTRIATAGHPLPVFSSGGATKEPDLPDGIVGLPLAIFPDANYEIFETDTPKDLTAIFYTDGLIEARGDDGLFGSDRAAVLFAYLVGQGLSPGRITQLMRERATEWSLGELKDDLAIICIKKAS